ncbi:hypothetical protein E1B28_010219 [Marasmius oreades]|uniref:F-box domain-containing protein n=1 Tax=Marasmius oreades TaxID=181124 RepID=A0A9P7RWU5_9AGAR|nr:uncharacterized protein E1B28_010219 [Marasmius oreades]KAG7091167.1 hypothetical protein E1B28_010219 [Marasmius oreades]
MTLPFFPLELCEAVIDHCHDIRPSLSACSLVSRSWLPRSRSHLFASGITLTANNIRTFCSLMDSQYCTMAPFIRSSVIFLIRVSSFLQLESLLKTVEQAFISNRLRISSITLVCIPHQLLHTSQLVALASTLTSLSLIGTLWYDEKESFSLKARRILDFVISFPSLETLEIGYETPGRIVPYTPLVSVSDCPRLSLPRLKRLQLGDIPYNAFLPWFLVPGAVDFPNLRFLSFFMGHTTLNVEPHLIQELLDRICAPTVETLSFWYLWESLPDLDLGAFKELRSLELYACSGDKSYYTKLPELISTVPTLGRVPLTVSVSEDSAFEPPAIDGVQWNP